MPSFAQASQHYQWLADQERQRAEEEARARDQAAALQAQATQQQFSLQGRRDESLAGYQSQQMAQQAEMQRQRDQLLIANQAQRDYAQHLYGQADRQQAFGQQVDLTNLNNANNWNARIQEKDLRAELNKTILTQSEEAEAKRTREAIAAVNRNPDLGPEEKSMLITQLQTKLNPLENRQRQSQILHTQIQTEGLHQQNQQQAVLFNQRQDFIQQPINFQSHEVAPGVFQYYYRNPDGTVQMVDSSRAMETHQMQLAQGAVGVAERVQNFQQQGALFPGVLAGQAQGLALGNVNLQSHQEALNFARNANPLQLERLRQAVAEGPRNFESVLAHRNAQTALLHLDAQQRPQEFEQHLRILTANATIAELNAAEAPNNTALAQQATIARILHEQASTAAIAVTLEPIEIELRRQVMQGRITAEQAQAEYQRAHTEVTRDQADRNWMAATLAEIGMITGQPVAGLGQRPQGGAQGGAGVLAPAAPGSPANGPPTPAPILTAAQMVAIENAAERDLANEVMRRQDAGQPAMTDSQEQAFLRQATDRRRYMATQTQTVSAMSPQAQALLRARLEALPADRQRRLGYVRPTTTARGPADFVGPPEPERALQRLITDIPNAIDLAERRSEHPDAVEARNEAARLLHQNMQIAGPAPTPATPITGLTDQQRADSGRHVESLQVLLPLLQLTRRLTADEVTRARNALSSLDATPSSEAHPLRQQIINQLTVHNPNANFAGQ